MKTTGEPDGCALVRDTSVSVAVGSLVRTFAIPGGAAF